MFKYESPQLAQVGYTNLEEIMPPLYIITPPFKPSRLMGTNHLEALNWDEHNLLVRLRCGSRVCRL